MNRSSLERWGVTHAQIAGLVFHFLGQLLQLFDHDAAVGAKERQAGAHLVVKEEDLQLLAQLAVIALLGLFQLQQVVLELLGVLPGRAVDALQHLVVLVAAPVGARHRHQLDGIRLELLRIGHVRPAAQVHEDIVLIDRDLRLLLERVAVLVEAALLEPVDQLELVGLVLEDLARLVGRDDLLHEVVLAGDDLAHALLDRLQVFGREVARQVEVVVEAVLDGRADGVLGLREHLHHGLRHDVRGRMAHLVQLGTLRTSP